MWPAWDDKRVSERHLIHAQKAVADGIVFRPAAVDDHPHANAILTGSISGFAPIGSGHHTIVAADASGSIVGALAMGEVVRFDQGTLFLIRGLAVEPAWRGHGVGVVLLHIAKEQVRGPGRNLHIGNCAPGLDARFYQRAGFTVLDPYQSLAIPLAPPDAPRWDIPRGSSHPCWFSRLS